VGEERLQYGADVRVGSRVGRTEVGKVGRVSLVLLRAAQSRPLMAAPAQAPLYSHEDLCLTPPEQA
jgi:hypothetical protein